MQDKLLNMNSDCSKPSPAHKPWFCSSQSPLMPSARGPKPSVAPKPKKIIHNGAPLLKEEGGRPNGSLKYNFIDKENVVVSQDVVQIVLKNGVESESKIERDWRLSDLTEKTESLETLDTVDSSEDVMDTEVCDGGEAMADTDGISMGDISVNSIENNTEHSERQDNRDEDCDQIKDVLRKDLSLMNNNASQKLSPVKTQQHSYGKKAQKQCHNEQEVADLTHPEVNNLTVVNDLAQDIGQDQNMKNINGLSKLVSVKIDRAASLRYNIRDQTIELEMEDPRSICNHREDISGKDLHLKNNNLVSVNIDRVGSFKFHQNPYRNATAGDVGDSDYVLTEEYVEISGKDKSNDLNKLKTCHDTSFGKDKEFKASCSNSPDSQPRFRLVSISKAKEAHLSSSLSDLLFPSDLFEKLDSPIAPFDLDFTEEHVYDTPGRKTSIGARTGSMTQRNNEARSYKSGIVGHSSSPMLIRHAGYHKPQYLPLYPRSLSMEGQEMQGSPMRSRAVFGNFSQSSPLSTPTSVSDIPPPFELAYITKKPITKSSPSLLIGTDSSEKSRKKKSSLKRFLMLKFRRKSDNKQPVISSSNRLPDLDLDTHSLTNSPNLNSRTAQNHEPAFLLFDNKKKAGSVSFLNRSVVRVESFEDRSRVVFAPLTKPRSISFPITDNSDYENVPPISSDYENVQMPQRRPVKPFPFTEYFERSNRLKTAATGNDIDGYVDMSSLPGFEKKQFPRDETERRKMAPEHDHH